jgi:hypothetical protein
METVQSSSLSRPSVNFVKHSYCIRAKKRNVRAVPLGNSCASDLRPSWEKLNVIFKRICPSLIPNHFENSTPPPKKKPAAGSRFLTSDYGLPHWPATCRQIRNAAAVRMLLIHIVYSYLYWIKMPWFETNLAGNVFLHFWRNKKKWRQ